MRTRKFQRRSAVLAVVCVLATLLVSPAAAAQAQRGPLVSVIVQAGTVDAAAEALEAHGGVVDGELNLIGAVSGRMSSEAVAALEAAPGVGVTLDAPVQFNADNFQPAGRDVQLEALNPGGGWSPTAGAGVGVALIDTGVAETPDLVDRVVHGLDLSGEGDGIDRYGHGTFMAGLIAGDGSASTGETIHYGTAPGAHVVSVKVAGRDGVTSLSKVLEGISWAVQHQSDYGIRVLSLSLGVVTPTAPQADPLSAAVEAAWASGLVVVAASGNEGTDTVTSPGRDPWVITVGATETAGTITTSDDTVPSWSGSGKVTGVQKPELLAPGASVVSLRAPGSTVDEAYPQARIDDHYFRGSGTSMAAAIAAGGAAILVQHHPEATPDDIKGALVAAGDPIDGTAARAIDLAGADDAEAEATWWQRHPVVANGLGGQLTGNVMPWARLKWADDTWARLKWADGQWTRLKWADGQWTRLKWADDNWARLKWAESEWTRLKWADGQWTRLKWADGQWTRLKWADDNWARLKWADGQWSGLKWADSKWSGLKWADSKWSGLKWAQAMWGDDRTP